MKKKICAVLAVMVLWVSVFSVQVFAVSSSGLLDNFVVKQFYNNALSYLQAFGESRAADVEALTSFWSDFDLSSPSSPVYAYDGSYRVNDTYTFTVYTRAFAEGLVGVMTLSPVVNLALKYSNTGSITEEEYNELCGIIVEEAVSASSANGEHGGGGRREDGNYVVPSGSSTISILGEEFPVMNLGDASLDWIVDNAPLDGFGILIPFFFEGEDLHFFRSSSFVRAELAYGSFGFMHSKEIYSDNSIYYGVYWNELSRGLIVYPDNRDFHFAIKNDSLYYSTYYYGGFHEWYLPNKHLNLSTNTVSIGNLGHVRFLYVNADYLKDNPYRFARLIEKYMFDSPDENISLIDGQITIPLDDLKDLLNVTVDVDIDVGSIVEALELHCKHIVEAIKSQTTSIAKTIDDGIKELLKALEKLDFGDIFVDQEAGTNIFDVIKSIPEALGDIFKLDFGELFKVIGKVVDGINSIVDFFGDFILKLTDMITDLVIPSDEFIAEQKAIVKEKYDEKFGFVELVEADIDKILGAIEESITYYDEPVADEPSPRLMRGNLVSTYPKFEIEVYGEKYCIIDFSFFAEYRTRVHSIMSAIIIVIFILRLPNRIIGVITGLGGITSNYQHGDSYFDGYKSATKTIGGIISKFTGGK